MPQDSTGIGALLDQRIGAVRRKQQRLADAAQRKGNKFNPLNIDNIAHVDGDTFKFIDSGKSFRVSSGDPNKSVDTFESHEWAYSDEAPGGRARFERHRRNMSKLTGRPEFAISKQDLLDRGRVQAEQTKQRMNALGQAGHLAITDEGIDATGNRILGELIDTRTGRNFFADHSNPEQNASFDSRKFNSQGIIDDILSGDRGERERFSGSRSIKDAFKDQVPNLLTGAGRMLNDITQTASVLTGTNSSGVDEFFGNNRDRLERFQERFLSPEAKSRNRQSERNAARQAEFFKVNKQRYMDEEGLSSKSAALAASIDEYGDSLKSILTNPGRILDATIESLPFMISVAGVSRVALSKAVKKATKEITQEITKKSGKKAAEQFSGVALRKYLASDLGKAAMNKVATRTATSSVGLLEGFSNGADVYDSIISMSEEEAAQSDKYQSLRAEGKTHEQAVKVLAEEALLGTVVATSLAAAAASKLSGAAGFEGNLLSNLGTKTTVAKGAKGVVKAGAVRNALRSVGKFTKTLAKPGRQEAVEETLQSGGGEFISQLESFEATGKEVGSGVGAATAEGGVIGFFSGAGASIPSQAIKAIAAGYSKAANNLERDGELPVRTVAPGAENTTSGGTIAKELADQADREAARNRPEGQTEPTAEEGEEAKQNILKAIQEMAKGFTQSVDTGEENEQISFGAFNKLTVLYQTYLRTQVGEDKADERKDVTKNYEVFRDIFHGTITQHATKALDTAQFDRTPEQEGAIRAAAELGILTEADKKRYVEEDENNDNYLNATSDTNDAVEAAKAAEVAQDSEEVHKLTSAEADRVYEEKMGMGVNKDGKPGLDAHVALHREAMNEPDPVRRKSDFLAAGQNLKNFYGSQQSKIAKYKQVIKEGLAWEASGQEGTRPSVKHSDGTIYWAAPRADGTGGTQGVLETQQIEIAQMARARQSLAKEYEARFGADNNISNVIKQKLPLLPVRPGDVESTGEPGKPNKPKAAAVTSKETVIGTKVDSKGRTVTYYSETTTIPADGVNKELKITKYSFGRSDKAADVRGKSGAPVEMVLDGLVLDEISAEATEGLTITKVLELRENSDGAIAATVFMVDEDGKNKDKYDVVLVKETKTDTNAAASAENTEESSAESAEKTDDLQEFRDKAKTALEKTGGVENNVTQEIERNIRTNVGDAAADAFAAEATRISDAAVAKREAEKKAAEAESSTESDTKPSSNNRKVVKTYAPNKRNNVTRPAINMVENLTLKGKKVLALSNGKEIWITTGITVDEFFDYFTGTVNDSDASKQKAETLNIMEEQGVTLEALKKLITTPNHVLAFISFHEQDHIDQRQNGEDYWKEGDSLLTPDKIAIEARANLVAYHTLNRYLKKQVKRTEADKSAQTDPVGRNEEPDTGENSTSRPIRPGEEQSKPKTKRQKKRGSTVVTLDPNAPFELNEGQKNAFDKVMAFFRDGVKKSFAIIGSAGTGKTTLIDEVIKEIRKESPGIKIVLSSPTHRANSVIRSKNKGAKVMTLHALLGMKTKVNMDDFDAKKVEFIPGEDPKMPFQGILVVDESSMIKDELYYYLLEVADSYGTRIIFLGDQAQLAPVRQKTDSLALTGTDGGKAELDQVMRAKNSQLLDESIYVREAKDFSNENDMDEDQNGILFMNRLQDFYAKAVELFSSEEFKNNPLLARMVPFTNPKVTEHNENIRRMLYGADAPALLVDEVLMAYSGFEIPGNKGEIHNGLDYKVKHISAPFNTTLFGVPVKGLNVTITEILSGKVLTFPLVDPGTSTEVQAEIAEAATKVIEAAEKRELNWARDYYAELNKIASPFELKKTRGNGFGVVRTITYGYAHTIHKSQGGTYKYILVDATNIDGNTMASPNTKSRLRYVAVTRAEKGAFVFTNKPILAQEEEAEQSTTEEPTVEDSTTATAESQPEAETQTAATKTHSGNVIVVEGVSAARSFAASSDNRIYTLRQRGNEHFGNPFTHLPINRTQGTVLHVGTIPKAVQAYRDWLTTDKYDGKFGPELDERKAWILSQLPSLKGKELIYYTELNQPSHANVLDELIQSSVSSEIDTTEVVDDENTVEDTQEDESGFESAQTPPPVDNSQATRLAAFRALQKRFKNGAPRSALEVPSPSDNATLQGLLDNVDENDRGAIQSALNEFLNIIEPNTNKRNVRNKPNPRIPQATRDKLLKLATVLNEGKKVKAIGINKFWRNVLEFTDKTQRILLGFAGVDPDKNPISGALNKARKYLERNKLPAALSEVFQSKKETGSLLSAIPNLMELLQDDGTRNELIAGLDITAAEEHALLTFVQFYGEFAKAFNDNVADLRRDVSWIDKQLRHNPLYYFENDGGHLDPNTLAAMALAGLNWVTGDGPSTLFNEDSTIRTLLGLEEWEEIPIEAAQRLRYAGTLRNNAARDAGFDSFDQLALEAIHSGKYDPNIRGSLIAALGSTTIGVLAKMDRVELQNFPGKWYRGLTKHLPKSTQAFEQTGVEIPFVRNNVEKNEEGKSVDVNTDVRDALIEGHAILNRLFGNKPRVRMPVFVKPTVPASRVSRSLTRISPDMRSKLLYADQREHISEMEMHDLVGRFDELELLRVAEGWMTEEEIEALHDVHTEGQRSLNVKLERDLSTAVNWGKTYKDKVFYLLNKMSRNGRVNSNSNVINLQQNTIHRAMFIMKEWTNRIKFSDAEAVNKFKMAFAFNMGIKIENNTRKESLDKVEELLNDGSFIAALDALDGTGPVDMSLIEPFLSQKDAVSEKGGQGLMTLRAMQQMNKFLKAQADPAVTEVTLTLPNESDGKNNGVAATVMQMAPANLASVRHILHASGIYLDDDPWNSFAEYVADGGLDNYQNIAKAMKQWILEMSTGEKSKSKTITDKRNAKIHERVLRVVASGLLPNLDVMEEKEGRKLTKNPLIVKIYGASTLSIKRKITGEALDQFYKKLAEAGRTGDAEAIAVAMMRGYEIINVALEANREVEFTRKRFSKEMGQEIEETIGPDTNFDWNATTVQQLADDAFGGDLQRLTKELLISGDTKTLFDTGVMETYGEALGGSIDEYLAPLEATRRQMHHTNRLSNEIFVADFGRRIAALSGPRNTVLSAEQVQGVLEQMHSEGRVPAIKTAQSEEDLRQALEVTKYKQIHLGGDTAHGRGIFLPGEKHGVPVIQWNEDASDNEVVHQQNIVSRILGKTPIVDVGVSTVVKMIHSLDGTNNSEVWGTMPTLNLHDANMGSFMQMDDFTELSNEKFGSTHFNYDLVYETGQSMLRMYSIMSPNDSRLTPALKAKIRADFVAYLIERKVVKDKYLKQTKLHAAIVDDFVNSYRNLMAANTQNKENLKSKIRVISQFAYEGAEATFTPSAPVNTRTRFDDMSLKTLMHHIRSGLTASGVPLVDAAIEDLLAVLLPEGDVETVPGAANLWIKDYLGKEGMKPTGDQVLEVLQAAYRRAGHPGGQAMANLNNLLKPYLGTVIFRMVPQAEWDLKVSDPKVQARYSIEHNWIEVPEHNRDTDLPHLAAPVSHELIHAAGFHRLRELEKKNNAEFERLVGIATDWADVRGPNGSRKAAEVIRDYLGRGRKAHAVSEYLAYNVTEQDITKVNYELEFNKNGRITPLLGELMDSLQDPHTGAVLLRNTQNQTSEELFDEAEGELLQIDQIASILERIEQFDETPTDPADRTHLLTFVRDFVIDGLRTVDPIWQQVVKDSNGTLNLGDIALREIEGTPVNQVRIQAGGNKLSNNAEMSLLETTVHEWGHAILRMAIDTNDAIRAEVRRLYELAEASPLITWESFMPTDEELVGSRADAELAARARFDYIFRHPEGQNYHEFAAIGLTNRRFSDALATVDNTAPEAVSLPTSLRQLGLLGALLQLFRRAVQWLGGNSIENSKGNVRDGLKAFAAEVVKYNQNNQARLRDIENNPDNRSRINKLNDAVKLALQQRVTQPLIDKIEKRAITKLETTDPFITKGVGLVKSATAVAIRSRNSEVRDAYAKFYKSLGGTRDNMLFEIASEITPFNEDDLGDGIHKSPGWLDLLRQSKTIVDKARQEAIEGTQDFLRQTFDRKNHLTAQTKRAITRVIFRTGLHTLIDGDHSLPDIQALADLLNSEQLQKQERSKLERLLSNELDAQNHAELKVLFDNAGSSLANYMKTGQHTVEVNGLDNAYQIVKQRMRHESRQVALENEDYIVSLVDRIVTLKALAITDQHDIDSTLKMVNHEMNRTDKAAEVDNGFEALIGEGQAFEDRALAELFSGNPTLMHKGYVYEIFDPEVSIEFIVDTPANNQKMLDKGMQRIGTLPVDPVEATLNPDRKPRAIYKGLNGLARYQKSIVSLTAMVNRGTPVFTVNGFQSQKSLRDLGRMKAESYRRAERQLLPNTNKAQTTLSPVFDELGNIADYRYTMTEANKAQLLQKEDAFDQVLPRMIGSITDKLNSKIVNENAATLMWKEYDAMRNDGKTTWVVIGPGSAKEEGREMFNLLPKEMQDSLRAKFGNRIYIRDNAVNLVMGFRKLTIANGKFLGKATPAVHMAEKWWQEVIQLQRIKIAVLTPAVVIGNAISNLMMLLIAGIPPSFIQKKGAEAISAMRKYVKDVRNRDIMLHQLQVRRVHGKDISALEARIRTANVNISVNPVARMVEQGLFTSITADLGIDEQTIRGKLITKAKDKLADSPVPNGAIRAVEELYMLPGSKGYQAGVAATQYGDFVARYIKFNYDTTVGRKTLSLTDEQKSQAEQIVSSIKINQENLAQFERDGTDTTLVRAALDRQEHQLHQIRSAAKVVRKPMSEIDAINASLAAFIYYDIPQNRQMQYLNDMGPIMFTKFFMRIQHVVARWYLDNPASAVAGFALQPMLFSGALGENISHYGFFGGIMSKPTLNVVGAAAEELNPVHPALLEWLKFLPFFD